MKLKTYKKLRGILKKLVGLDIFRLYLDSPEGIYNANHRLLKYDQKNDLLVFQVVSTGKTYIIETDEFLSSNYNIAALGYCIISNWLSKAIDIDLTLEGKYEVYMRNSSENILTTFIPFGSIVANGIDVLLIRESDRVTVTTNLVGFFDFIKKVKKLNLSI